MIHLGVIMFKKLLALFILLFQSYSIFGAKKHPVVRVPIKGNSSSRQSGSKYGIREGAHPSPNVRQTNNNQSDDIYYYASETEENLLRTLSPERAEELRNILKTLSPEQAEEWCKRVAKMVLDEQRAQIINEAAEKERAKQETLKKEQDKLKKEDTSAKKSPSAQKQTSESKPAPTAQAQQPTQTSETKPAPTPQDQPATSTSPAATTPPPPPSDKNPNLQPIATTKAPTSSHAQQQITTPLQTTQIPQSQKRQGEQPQPKPQAPTFTRVAKYALKKGLAAGAGELIRNLVHEAIHGIFSHEQPSFHAPVHDDLPFPEALTAPLSHQGFDPIVGECLMGDVHPDSNGMVHFNTMPHLQNMDPIVRECLCNDGPVVDYQPRLSSHPQPTISPAQDPQFYEPIALPIIEPAPAPTPLTLSSTVNAAGQGGIIHDQQPSSIASSSLSSSCSSTPPLHTMDTTTTAQSSDPVTFHRTREHCFGVLAQALELAEKSPYKPIVENACKAAETLDKIAQVLNESGEFGLSRECVYYADACALAAHGFADSTQGALLGLNDAAHDCAYAAAHPIQTAQSYIKANLEFAKLIFELGKLCFDPALSGHRIETAQHMAAALGQAIEEKIDHMQHASLQQNAREIAHFVATAKAKGMAQNVAFQQLGKLTKYVARLKNAIEADKKIAESLGSAPLIEKSLEKAGAKAQQLETAIKGEQILPKVATYEQARNEALKLIGDMGTGSTAYYGRLQCSKGFGKIIGRVSADGKVRWYLDYDPIKGMHINVHDFRLGKGLNAKKYALPFDGTEETFEALLKHLNR